MDRRDLYRNIAQRTGGNIYIGVVGPVRTGKSTFIKRFMDTLIVPYIDDEYEKKRIIDELPQSATGRTIMTTQPKFIPNEAAKISFGENAYLNVRLIDCVGYMIPNAEGHTEGNMPRMVRTPWYSDEIPFEQAAEIGTHKVITEHSSIGVVMTTDGSITQIGRDDYSEAEERVIRELKAQNKPFVVILNSVHPTDAATVQLADSLSEKYGINVHPMNVLAADASEYLEIIELMLMEFPVRMVQIDLPDWLCELGMEHYLVKRICAPLMEISSEISIMRDYSKLVTALSEVEDFYPAEIKEMSMGCGAVRLDLRPNDKLFYRIIGEECGIEIKDDAHLVASLKSLSKAKRQFDVIEGALQSALNTGYGMVAPQIEDMQMEEPEIVKQGNKFGVKLKAHASGLHLIKVDMESEVAPLVGSESQSEEFLKYLNETFRTQPEKIWDTEIFGKTLREMVRESMTGKASRLPDEVQQRLQWTVQKMVNDGCNGLICIML